jgi:hypothetical protein
MVKRSAKPPFVIHIFLPVEQIVLAILVRVALVEAASASEP